MFLSPFPLVTSHIIPACPSGWCLLQSQGSPAAWVPSEFPSLSEAQGLELEKELVLLFKKVENNKSREWLWEEFTEVVLVSLWHCLRVIFKLAFGGELCLWLCHCFGLELCGWQSHKNYIDYTSVVMAGQVILGRQRRGYQSCLEEDHRRLLKDGTVWAVLKEEGKVILSG